MNNRYKVILYNQSIYKEIELSTEMDLVTVGTSVEHDIRLRKEMFFCNIELQLKYINDQWFVFCSDNLYMNLGDSRKLLNLELHHGMQFKICYQESGNEAFTAEFMIDFNYEEKNYDREIDLSTVSNVKIGGVKEANISIDDAYLGTDYFSLERENNDLILRDFGCKYGVFVNGEKINGSKNIYDHDFISVVGYSFYYINNKLYTTSSQTHIRIQGLEEKINHKQTTIFKYPKFNRNTRIQYEIPQEEIEIQQPVNKPSLSKKSIVMTLIPTLVMLAMTVVLRGVMGGGGTFVIYSAVSMGMGAVMSVITYVQDKKNYQEEVIKREKAYKEYVDEKEALLKQSRENELRIRRLIYESLENSIKEAEEYGKRLFEKSLDDKDFLQIYLGTGTIASQNPVKFSKQEFIDAEDPISLIPEELANKYKYIENAPISADFNHSNGIGIVGEKRQLYELLKNITLDIVIRHFYKDVHLVYMLERDYLEQFQWVRWLKNVDNEMLDVNNIICDEESKNLILENIYAILSMREAQLAENHDIVFSEQYVMFVTNAASISTHPISKYIANSIAYGFTFVFLEEYEENLPQGCTEIIRLNGSEEGQLINSSNGDVFLNFKYPQISNKTAEKVALRLGAVSVDEVSLEGQLTKNITMFELLKIISVEDLDLKKRWSESQVYKSMEAPIGVKSNNEIVSLNISDKANGHGPHGLVAGTTGSGKSEILQTYILSLATLFHPYDVGFVIIDFKGGGMANQFTNLPHLIGTITNIDGREIDRSLLSIKAELVKRQELFSIAGVNHINDYIKLFKAGKVEQPMPHLIIIVDEFAELKAEYPDFMKELISAARIGRTLGVHLILATQKPAGVVDAQIWSNSKFKLCLKVQTKEDSNEVIKSPLAAEIVEPGRAYFQVGNNEIFELIQSAYSGAEVPEGYAEKERTFTVYERNIWGKKTPVYTNKKKKKNSSDITQLDAIIQYVNMFCNINQIKKLPGICLPSLQKVIRTDELNYECDQEEGYVVPLGLYDDPEMQRQGMVELEIAKDNVYIVGSAQMGKTVLLQTLIYGLCRKYTSEQINFYIVDCGSMVLKIFEDSKHVGGVVLSNEEEKCKNLFKMLNKMVIDRKKILSGKGVGNFASYLEAGFTDIPLAVVIIDNMAAFKEYFPDQADQINSLAREAQGVGISFIVTAATSNALNYRTQANFGKKFSLNCNDVTEYSNLFGHCRKTPRENPGSGLFVMDKRILEWQVAIFGKTNKEADRSRELKEFIVNRNQECLVYAAKIPMVPEKLNLEDEMEQHIELFRNKGILPVGMRFDTIEYDTVNITENGSLVLLGDVESKTRFMRSLLRMLAQNIVFHNAEIVIIDDKQRSLESLNNYGFVKEYTSDVSEGMAYVSDYQDEVSSREDDEYLDECETTILLINNMEVMRQISSDRTMAKELADTIKKAGDLNAFLIFSQVENATVGFNSSEVLKVLKEQRQGILFTPITDNKFYDMSGRVRSDSAFDVTMGYRFDNGVYYKIKIFE